MSISATVTLTKKANLIELNLIEGESIWNNTTITKALDKGLASAEVELDKQMKGWEPKAEGKETHYGMNGNSTDLEFWYQRQYTK